jgi:hypothetical protein
LSDIVVSFTWSVLAEMVGSDVGGASFWGASSARAVREGDPTASNARAV